MTRIAKHPAAIRREAAAMARHLANTVAHSGADMIASEIRDLARAIERIRLTVNRP